jgi:hypothetical protein
MMQIFYTILNFVLVLLYFIFVNNTFDMVFAKKAKTHAKGILTLVVSTDCEQVLVRGYRY